MKTALTNPVTAIDASIAVVLSATGNRKQVADNKLVLAVCDYDLAGTLACGQAFRWRPNQGAWEGVIGNRWVRLESVAEGVQAQTAEFQSDWQWLTHYLQAEVDLARVISTFPVDEPMRNAVAFSRGLRLLRQEPWECLASFILSSTKQIVQIQQIVELLCTRYGDRLKTAEAGRYVHAFPTIERIAVCAEAELRDCKMGFRAPYLRESAQMILRGEVNLARLHDLNCEQARNELLKLPGVGRKIADCVLLFAYGFPEAFPVDVWVAKALQELYFPKRKMDMKRLLRFSATHFGSHSGYAQQYLFHYMRLKDRRNASDK